MNPHNIIIEGLVVSGYKELQPRGIDDEEEIIVLMAVPTTPDPINDTAKALWYDSKKKTVTIMPYAAVSDPYRVTNIDSAGKIACGFDKGRGHISTWQPGVGIRTYACPAGYTYARAVAINKSKAVVGYVEMPDAGGPKRQGVWKKGEPSTGLALFKHPNADQVTEFTSIADTGVAIGKTDTGYIFTFNVNTEVWSNTTTPPPIP